MCKCILASHSVSYQWKHRGGNVLLMFRTLASHRSLKLWLLPWKLVCFPSNKRKRWKATGIQRLLTISSLLRAFAWETGPFRHIGPGLIENGPSQPNTLLFDVLQHAFCHCPRHEDLSRSQTEKTVQFSSVYSKKIHVKRGFSPFHVKG